MSLVSVIIPLYNKASFIEKTIYSVLEQTFTDYEIIVVNDGSTDHSRQIVESINSNRITIIDKVNGGVSSARNLGIAHAKGEWIFFLDGDDTIQRNCLEALIVLRNQYPEATLCCANFETKYPGCTQKKYCKASKQYIIKNNFKDFWTQRFFLRTGCFLVKKDVFEKIGLFNEQSSIFEDLELFIKMLDYCTIAYTPEVVFLYKKEGSEASRGFSKSKKMYNVVLNGNTGYKKKVLTKVLIDELITCRKDKTFAKELLLRNKQNLAFIAILFLPCFFDSLINAQVPQRILNKFFK